MVRPTMAPPKTAQLALAAWIAAPLVIALTLTLASVGCKPVEVIPAPDSGDDIFVCETKPIPFCDAMAPGAGGCVADPASKSRVVRDLPADRSYPVGCVANLIEPIAEKDCRIVATCRCVVEDAGPETDVDAGDADAAPVAQDRRVWSCFP